jgi:hypothetical protein
MKRATCEIETPGSTPVEANIQSRHPKESKMSYPSKLKASALAVMLATASFSAQAVLERVGPVSPSPSVGGFPSWYQDTSGLTLEFCDPKNQAEVDGGWCLLLPGDVVAPEVFPSNFFDEHFYYAANAIANTATGARALLVLATEAAFATGPAVPGDQVVFSRIRIVLSPAPVTGTYRFIHPYGEERVDAVAGERIFFTEDIGIGAPGDFSGALNSRLGPFLLPATTPGGAEQPAVAGPSGLYIADPNRIGPVTGSGLPDFTDSTGALRNHNIFRIEGPAGSGLGVDPLTGALVDYVETTDFSLMGRVFTGSLPGRVAVDRASYTRDATSQKVDVYATAAETTQGRVPAQPRPAPVAPQLSFYDAPCAGTVDPVSGVVSPPYSAPAGATKTQMFETAPGIHWGQNQPVALPAEVCLEDSAARDAAGNIVPAFIPSRVTDEVTISQAAYDPGAGTLTVAATSSDTAVPPTLSLAYGTYRGDLVGGTITVPGMIAPPSKVRVLSSAQGSKSYQVSTGVAAGAPAPGGIPVAANDAFGVIEDSGASVLSVLVNDTNAAGGTVTLSSATRLGSALVNPDGTVTYTPNPNASGTDQFTYTVTVGTAVSNTGTVSIDISPVNDPPTAVNDTFSAIANVAAQLNVLANDGDPEGAADLVAAVNVTTPVGATVAVAGGIVSFTAPAGTYSFTYQAQDAAGVISANTATATVTVAGIEALSFVRAEYVLSKSRLRAEGTISPAANQTVTVVFVDSAGTVLGSAGSAVADAAGNWFVDGVVPLPAGSTALRATSSNGTVQAQALSLRR